MWIYDRRMANVKATWWLTVLLRPTIIYLLKALCLWGSSVACVAVHCLDLYVRAISVKVCWCSSVCVVFRCCNTGFSRLLESPGFFSLKFPGPEKSWKMSLFLESPGICLLSNLNNMPSMYRTPCVNKCIKNSCYVLTEEFLCNLWWTFCDGLYCHTVYTQ